MIEVNMIGLKEVTYRLWKKESKKEWICVYGKLIHFTVQLKLTHFKLILKINKNIFLKFAFL